MKLPGISSGIRWCEGRLMQIDFSIHEKSSFGVLKVGENQWMQKFYNGTLSFSCAQAYINQGRTTGNQEQGDPDEGIFAQLYENNPLIPEMQCKLGDDLEIYRSGEFVLLRRKSACRKPIFCFYTIKHTDFFGQLRHTGINKVKIPINQKIYEGFLTSLPNAALSTVEQEKRKMMSVFFDSKPFFQAVYQSLRYRYQEPAKSDNVKYDIMDDKEFFVEPDDSYPELFYKRERYCYQHEVRIILTDKNFGRIPGRFNIEIGNVVGRQIFPRLTHIETHMTVL